MEQMTIRAQRVACDYQPFPNYKIFQHSTIGRNLHEFPSKLRIHSVLCGEWL